MIFVMYYLSILAAIILPYSMIKSIKCSVNNQDSFVYTSLACLSSVIIFITVFMVL